MVADRAPEFTGENAECIREGTGENIEDRERALSRREREDAADLLSIKRQLENYLRYFVSKKPSSVIPAKSNAKHSRATVIVNFAAIHLKCLSREWGLRLRLSIRSRFPSRAFMLLLI